MRPLSISFQHVLEIYALMQEAGRLITEIYHSDYKTTLKHDHSPVTTADLLSHNHIYKNLTRLFPATPIISEEGYIEPYSKRKLHPDVWLLDPLDGTKEFIEKTNEFSINLALIHKNKAVAGFIYLPIQKAFYYGIKNRGAFELFEDLSSKSIHCSNFSMDQQKLRVLTTNRALDPRTKSLIDRLDNPKLIKLGSALKFISIANGQADYYPRMINIMEWDTAAGQIIIEEAGGSIVDAITGEALTYNKEVLFNPYFIASGKKISHEVQL